MIYTIDKSKQTKEGLACSKACQKVLTDKLSMEETEKEIAYIALNYGFDELDFHHFKMNMPKDLMEYIGASYKDRKVELSFWLRPDIDKYVKAKKAYDASMKSNYDWLQKLTTVFNKNDDFVNAKKCEVKVGDYKQFLFR